MNTTRKYPRTLNEAFPHTAEYGCPLTVYRRSDILGSVVKGGAWLLVLVMFYGLLSGWGG